jgi:hypothetical protein
MALKVVNLVVSGIGGNLGIFTGASCEQDRKIELNFHKSKKFPLSESGIPLLSMIFFKLESLEIYGHSKMNLKGTFANWITSRWQCTL